MLRVQSDKPIGGGNGGFRLGGAVMGVDNLQLRLLGIRAEGIARFQQLQVTHRQGKVFIGEIFPGQFVEFLFGHVLWFGIV